MNKEIIKQIIIDTINGEEHLGENLKKQCIEYIEELQQENQKLQERINKAIEYMKNNATSNYFDKEKNMFRREEDLLEILKGVE